MDDLLILAKVDWKDHVQKLELTPNKMKEKGLKCNIEKSFFGKTEMEYLCFWVTPDGVNQINRKIEAITNMKPSTSQKEVRNFIGVINYYRDMWPRWSYTLAPLTRSTSIKRKFKWTQVEKYNFEKLSGSWHATLC